jgi:hypothetical protein
LWLRQNVFGGASAWVFRTGARPTRKNPKPDGSLEPATPKPGKAPGGPTLRLHIGIESVEDLNADLDRGSAALKAASPTRLHPTIPASDLPLHGGG